MPPNPWRNSILPLPSLHGNPSSSEIQEVPHSTQEETAAAKMNARRVEGTTTPYTTCMRNSDRYDSGISAMSKRKRPPIASGGLSRVPVVGNVAAAEGCPQPADSHRRAGHMLEDLRGRGHNRLMYAGEQHRSVVGICLPAAHHPDGRRRALLGDYLAPNKPLPTRCRPEHIRELSDAERAKFDNIRLLHLHPASSLLFFLLGSKSRRSVDFSGGVYSFLPSFISSSSTFTYIVRR